MRKRKRTFHPTNADAKISDPSRPIGDTYRREERLPHGVGFAIASLVMILFWAAIYLFIIA